jgi:hypothetical protein
VWLGPWRYLALSCSSAQLQPLAVPPACADPSLDVPSRFRAAEFLLNMGDLTYADNHMSNNSGGEYFGITYASTYQP